MPTMAPEAMPAEAASPPEAQEPTSASFDLLTFPPVPTSPVQFPPVQFDFGFSRRSELEHVRDLVDEDDKGKWDLTLPRQSLAWQGERLVLPESCEGEVPTCLSPSPWALAQVCEKLGIPAAYFRRCPAHLQEAQFNHWAQSSPEDRSSDPWLLRGKGSVLRGVLSSRYAKMDNRQLLDLLMPLVDDRFQVSWQALTAESFHLRLMDPALSKEALPGDRLLAGIHVGNSEVGKRCVSIDAIVFRLVCSNGLIRVIDGKGLLRQRHVSFDPPWFKERMSRAISAALVEAASFLERLGGRMQVVVPDMERALGTLSERWGLSLALRQSVKVNLLASPANHQETLWGLVNALTLSAQGLAPDERYDLEAKAGWLAEHGTASELVGRHAMPTGVGSGRNAMNAGTTMNGATR